MKIYDVIIVGGGAAGLKAAGELHKQKKSVLIIDMGHEPARKIAISGGGNCNFTNTKADHLHYFGKNPQFVRSALHQWTPFDTLNWVKSHKIQYVEPESGRYFCKNGAKDILNALIQDIGNTKIVFDTKIISANKENDLFILNTDQGDSFYSKKLIIASGGISYPHLQVSNIGHIIAKHFGHKIEPVRPALCAIKTKAFNSDLSGISLPVEIKINKTLIRDDLLFTHFGIGGPASYRASLFDIKNIAINFAPGIDVFDKLKQAKQNNGKKNISNVLSTFLPNKLARFLSNNNSANIADIKDSVLLEISNKITHFTINDASYIGMQSAEITFGGISVDEISSKTMESKLCSGLFFAGEVMDISGDLGGFNLQWAFSSGYVAAINA